MARRRTFALLVSAVLVLGQVSSVLAASTAAGPGRTDAPATAAVDKGLVEGLRAGSTASFVVEFAAKADLRDAARVTSRGQRGKAVADALRTVSNQSAAETLKLGKGTRGVTLTAYWLTNVVLVEANVARGNRPDHATANRLAALAEKLAKVRGVAAIRAEKQYPLVKPVAVAPVIGILAAEPEWGVDMLRAPEAWDEGITGAGIVVANIDTGVEYTHEALVEQYRGNLGGGTFDHNYNWFDPTGICGDEPCDNAGHGTHVMGTMVGGDLDGPLPDIGVAPGASWIAAKGCEDFGCSEGSLLDSGQWVIEPTDLDGLNPDASKRPDIVNNSWGNDNPEDTFYLETVQAWRAAGIIPVFAAGNAGPGCGTAGTPGNFVEVISAGATNEADEIAEFSSRGPSPTEKISPNISAPGEDVISSVPGNGYESFSGTSMASPHTAGAIALMMSAELALAGDFDAVLAALNATAVDKLDDQCGSPDEDLDPNFVHGEGRIDAKAAVDLVKSGGTLLGVVRDADTSAPIAGAKVSADDGERTFSTTTDATGSYDLFLAAGTYTVSAEAFGYAVAAVLGTVVETDQETVENFELDPLPRFTVSGQVTSAESGDPLEGASVIALGTPVAPAITNPNGVYELELPIGDYALEASLSGCTDDAQAEISSAGDDVEQDFQLARKLDDFGHACRPIEFAWADAGIQSALFGDEFAGRLRLPFSFPFYGEDYGAVFLSDNGYLNFLEPEQFNSFPVDIPSPFPPNAAIYLLWQDLRLDEESSIDYETIGTEPNRAFVIEYAGVRAGSARLSFEVKLWEDGTIDLLYGDNPGNPGDGRNALVGIENADGTDALSISFLQRRIGANAAIRIETVPVGTVSGTVLDANDLEPISGATVSASPGSRHATTDADGNYSLNLLAGDYDLTVVKGSYEPGSATVNVVTGETDDVDFFLNAATAAVDPTALEAQVAFGESVTLPVTLSNDGSATLTWEAKERDLGSTLPELPPAVAGVFRTPSYSRVHLPSGFPMAVVNDFDPGSLPVIVDDPDDDSTGVVENTAIRGQSDGAQTMIALDYTASTPLPGIGGYVYLDTDQDPSTGLPPEAFFGLPTQDIGFDYFVELFFLGEGFAPVFSVEGELVAEVPALVEEGRVSFAIPLDALGGDDGAIDVAVDNGTVGPEDWVPDVGHGTIETFSDLPWLSAAPASGEIGLGGDDTIQVTVGGEGVAPGTYTGQLVFVTNAPKFAQVAVDVTLEVTLPDEFGGASGTVTDAHSGEPIEGAALAVHTEWMGAALELVATSGPDGTWSVVGPEGEWPTDIAADGYVPAEIATAIVRGVTTGGADASLHRDQAHAVLEGGPFSFVLTPGQSGHGTIVLSNPEGHRDLGFEVFERSTGATVSGQGSAGPAGTADSRTKPDNHTATAVQASILGNPTLVLMDVLPWESDAIQQVLEANSIPFDVAGSGDLDGLDLGSYHAIYIANDQPQSFYEALLGHEAELTSWVAGGGYLWFGAAVFGFQDGDLDGFVLPGGLTIHGPAFEDENDVAAPDHPIMAGIPSPVLGTSASHVTFSDVPAGGVVLATGSGSGDPTLVEYELGAGRILAVGLTIEFGFAQGQDTALVLENAVPYIDSFIAFSDLPWLSVTPATGSIAPDGSTELSVDVDTTDLEPGVYGAQIVIRTTDPDNASFRVPVTVVVPAYRQGVNAGGVGYTRTDGVTYAADQSYGTGSFGYLGASSTRSTGAPIAGTDEDPLYQTLRTGMSGYRFDVEDGVYRVDLSFAELQARRAGARVFSVSIEGGVVLSNLDVYAEAGGQRAALDRSFLVEVTDGALDITFAAQRGDAPIVNAILVTHQPEGVPEL